MVLCVVWRIGGQKSHPEFHRVRGECALYNGKCPPYQAAIISMHLTTKKTAVIDNDRR